MHECRCTLGPEGVGSPGGGVIGDFKLPDVGAKTKFGSSAKTASAHSFLSHLSSPRVTFKVLGVGGKAEGKVDFCALGRK